MVRLGVVGCGDVAFRTYLPGIRLVGEDIQVVACFDTVQERAERAASMFPGARAYTSYDDLLEHEGLDAILNLTPAPFHREVTGKALDAGKHVFSEKPIAASIEDAQALTEQARQAGKVLMVAPSVMATARFRYLKQLIDSGALGRPTLAVGQMANMGPATWYEYTGDPSVFYSAAVGPMLDTGVYVLHGITGLLGPAKRIEAFGGISIPERTTRIQGQPERRIDVETNDHMLIHLDFGNNTFAQVLSSFAVPNTFTRNLEVHCTRGSISIDNWYDANGPVDIYLLEENEIGHVGWNPDVPLPVTSPVGHLIQAGLPHFAACIQGREQPVLSAEHATHVLEIILKAAQSAREGCALELETTF